MLIARDGELRQITTAFERSNLVTITGPGGVGKTTLARAVLAGDAQTPTVGLIAELASLDGRRFASAVAGELGYGSIDDLIDHLARQRDLLLVVDNCEHVLDPAADLISRLLHECPNVRILATTRERLDLPDEMVVPLYPLSTEGPTSDARIMFDAVARRHGVAATGDVAAVAKLVERLDGLPLALELAAARTVAMTPSEILRHVDAKLDIISRARRRGPQRHQSLEATIAWSYQLLSDEEQLLLKRLSVIPPPFTQDAALAVGASTAVVDHLDELTRLVDRSLLLRDTHGHQSWYRMLDTIRVYAAEQLTDLERHEAEQRLIDYLEARTGQLRLDLRNGRPESLAELRRTFRSRVWAIDLLFDRADVDRCLRLLSGLWWLEDSGHQGEVIEVLERVLQHQSPSDNNAEARAVLAMMYRIGGRVGESQALASAVIGGGNDLARAFGHRTLGLIHRGEGRWVEADDHFEAGATAAKRADEGEVALEISMHAALGRWRSGDRDGARRLADELRDRATPFPTVAAWIAVFQSLMYLGSDPDRTRAIATGLAASESAANDPWVAGWCSVDLAMVELLENGDGGVAEAARLVAGGLAHFIDIGNRTDIAHPLLVASACAMRAGLVEEGHRIAATAYHAYPRAVLGQSENEVMERLGAPRSVDVDHPRMSPPEAIEVLNQLAAGRPPGQADDPPSDMNRICPDGDGWLLTYRGRTIRTRDTKGMANLARLLARPHVEIPAVDLMETAVLEQAADVVADRAARDAYRQRVRDLQTELDEATEENNPVRAERARAELDRLIEELQAAYGLGGAERATTSTAERARSAARWRIRDAIKRIESVDPALGAHLDRSISTGRFCSYRPAEATTWLTH